ncbi:hypothetical protein [Halorubellus sp. PRR65]|uniref:hypothetical protein n=1 Tax=Halorubellus sp. PRR65 TaxID=3098148 RepID=UPI002B263336|nr:hypothetical protein [Halorubellus sp. PRR65]
MSDPASEAASPSTDATADDESPLAPRPLRALSLACAFGLILNRFGISLLLGAAVIALRPRIDVFPAWRVAVGAIAIISTVGIAVSFVQSGLGVSLGDTARFPVDTVALVVAVAGEWYVYHRDPGVDVDDG